MASRLVNAHIEAQARLRTLTSRGVVNAWQSLPSYDERDVPQFLDLAVPLVTASQRHSVSLTEAFLARALSRRPLGVSPVSLIGAAVRNGSPPEEVYRRPFVTVWTALKDGTKYEAAVNSGLARATSTAEMDIQLSSRATFQAVQDLDDGIYGYARAADPGACDYCAAIDGAYVKSADASPLHNHCGCGLEPLTRPHPRAAYLPSGVSVHDGFAIHEHGELGAVLTDPSHDFTTAAEALS